MSRYVCIISPYETSQRLEACLLFAGSKDVPKQFVRAKCMPITGLYYICSRNIREHSFLALASNFQNEKNLDPSLIYVKKSRFTLELHTITSTSTKLLQLLRNRPPNISFLFNFDILSFFSESLRNFCTSIPSFHGPFSTCFIVVVYSQQCLKIIIIFFISFCEQGVHVSEKKYLLIFLAYFLL